MVLSVPMRQLAEATVALHFVRTRDNVDGLRVEITFSPVLAFQMQSIQFISVE